MRFIDFFAGIGGFHSGMKLAGHQCVGYVEWDKFARQSYESMYDTKGVYTANDIRAITNGNELPQADVWCFGSPCTNISLAGNRKGLHGEASSMFFEVMRLLHDREEVHRPAYLFMENVKNLLSSNGGRDFAEVVIKMGEAGYDVEWEVINSKNVVPQNRERVFIVGHKRGIATQTVFPVELATYRTDYRILADALEDDVDGKYFLSNEKQKRFIKNFESSVASETSDSEIKIVSNVGFGSGIRSKSRVHSDRGICSTLVATDYKEPKTIARIPIVNGTKKGFSQATYGDGIDLAYPDSKTRRGRVQPQRSNTLTANQNQGVVDKKVYPCLTPDRINKRQNGRRFKNNGEPSFTITACDRHGVAIQADELLVRKLTPLECWRLQGFTDEQFYKAKNSGVSDSQLYKQAGNAVTVPVIHAIADKLKIKETDDNE